MINRTCENCKKNERIDHTICNWCLLSKDRVEFVPKEGLLNEESIRKDEREKMIEKIKKFYHPARNEKLSNSMNFLELLVYLKED